MKTQHTPGPWEIGYNFRIQDFENRNIIANVVYRDSNRLAQANARLIAAAPELLEACKSMLSALTLVDARLDVEESFALKMGEDDYILGGCHIQIKEQITSVEQATKKAGG